MTIRIQAPLSREAARQLKAGDSCLLSGIIYTARDAAHKRLYQLLQEGKDLPFDLHNAVIYYVGPTPSRPGQVIGSAGPTTSYRMDAYAPALLAAGQTGMIGKGRRGLEVIEAMQQQGAAGLIFDLRNNGGGTLASVEEMLDYILPEGVLVSAEYKNGVREELFTSDAQCVDLPMAVLTNGSTASASELFAAAVRDMGKGVLVGEKTYGKGVMQQTYNLSDGSAIRITIAKFYPPSGVNFDGTGLEPDIAVSLTEDESKYFYRLEPENDSQVRAAIDYFASLNSGTDTVSPAA